MGCRGDAHVLTPLEDKYHIFCTLGLARWKIQHKNVFFKPLQFASLLSLKQYEQYKNETTQ